MKKASFSKRFYTDKKLIPPEFEYHPDTIEELTDLAATYPLIAVGGANDINPQLLRSKTKVVRFTKFNTIISLDPRSKLARVESGMSWSDFKTLAKERGMSTFEYRLYRDESTLGGLLSRRTHAKPALWNGDLRNYCYGLNALHFAKKTPSIYHYHSAPRKASGPDLRSFWFGAEGKYGFILDLTLGLFKAQDKLILSWKGSRQILKIPSYLGEHGARFAWAHGTIKKKKCELHIAFSGPSALLNAIISTAEKSEFPTPTITRGEECDQKRNTFESQICSARGERFVKNLELKEVNNVTFINVSMHGFTILGEPKCEVSTLKWPKKLRASFEGISQ